MRRRHRPVGVDAGQVRRLVGKAVKDFEARCCRSTPDRLSHATRSRPEDLVADEGAAQANPQARDLNPEQA